MKRKSAVPVRSGFVFGSWLIGAILLLAGCTGPPSPPPADQSTDGGSEQQDAQQTRTGGKSMVAGLTDTPKSLISHQFVLVKNGQAEALKPLFVESLRDQITPEMLEEYSGKLPPISLDDLVAEVVPDEAAERETVIVKRSDGSTLTRLVRQGDSWQADTLWFKSLVE